MPENNTLDLIQYALEKKPVDFADTFNSLIGQKVIDALNTKKQEIASTMFNQQDDYSDDELNQALDDADTEIETVEGDEVDLSGETDEDS